MIYDLHREEPKSEEWQHICAGKMDQLHLRCVHVAALAQGPAIQHFSSLAQPLREKTLTLA
jgi:hypothetical protein